MVWICVRDSATRHPRDRSPSAAVCAKESHAVDRRNMEQDRVCPGSSGWNSQCPSRACQLRQAAPVQDHSRDGKLDMPITLRQTHVPLRTRCHHIHSIYGCPAAWWIIPNIYYLHASGGGSIDDVQCREPIFIQAIRPVLALSDQGSHMSIHPGPFHQAYCLKLMPNTSPNTE